ncbi:MAG: HD domain-containing protein [Candidatus Aenigmarchaeota archaeon]|nr:HD domain-containing protein [Candidatus Aenigmarchaeota archaeon]
MRKLTELTKKDPRIKKVYDYAKKKYDQADLPQHNFEHIIRDLFRTLMIADTEKGVNYSVLVPAVLLHDIGATEGDYWKHNETGPKIAERDLPKFGFNNDEIRQIAHCIASHSETKSKIKPQTIEAKILFDADKLEKSDLLSLFPMVRVSYEFGYDLKKSVETFMSYADIRNSEFYTKEASDIDNNGIEKNKDFSKELKNTLKKRKDFLATEEDVW